MGRLNIERRKQLEPGRMWEAICEIEDEGYQVIEDSDKELSFYFKNHLVRFWPYSGWHSGKSIKDGRGLQNLLKQI